MGRNHPQCGSRSAECDEDIPTIDVPGLGSVPSPSNLGDPAKRRERAVRTPVPSACPVEGCDADGFETFAQLTGHFGSADDEAHRAYDLSLDDYRGRG